LAPALANTELEAAMPVDFQIKNAEIQAVGALVLMMHASELAEGNHWQKVWRGKRSRHWADGLLRPASLGRFRQNAWLWGGKQGLIQTSGQRKQMLALLERNESW